MGPSLISFNAAAGRHDVNLVAKVMSDEEGRKAVDALLRRHKDEIYHLLHENRDLVEALRDALLEREELLGDEILKVLENAKAARTAT